MDRAVKAFSRLQKRLQKLICLSKDEDVVIPSYRKANKMQSARMRRRKQLLLTWITLGRAQFDDTDLAVVYQAQTTSCPRGSAMQQVRRALIWNGADV